MQDAVGILLLNRMHNLLAERILRLQVFWVKMCSSIQSKANTFHVFNGNSEVMTNGFVSTKYSLRLRI
jgi:hypothetical protein